MAILRKLACHSSHEADGGFERGDVTFIKLV